MCGLPPVFWFEGLKHTAFPAETQTANDEKAAARASRIAVQPRFLHKAALPRKIMPHATCISNLYFYLCLRRVKQRGAPGKAGLRLYPHQYKEDLMQVMLP